MGSQMIRPEIDKIEAMDISDTHCKCHCTSCCDCNMAYTHAEQHLPDLIAWIKELEAANKDMEKTLTTIAIKSHPESCDCGRATELRFARDEARECIKRLEGDDA